MTCLTRQTQGSTAMFRFTCPSCHHGLKAPESLSGKKVKCPGCGGVITVPEPPLSPHETTRPGGSSPPTLEIQTLPPIEEPGRAEAPPPATILVPDPASVLVPTPPDQSFLADEPLTASLNWPSTDADTDSDTGGEADQKDGDAEQVFDPVPMAQQLSANGLRSAYFAPAGYVGSDRSGVPFLAPDLRRRLMQASEAPEPPDDPSSPSADRSAYLVTRTPRWGDAPAQQALPGGVIAALDPVLAGVFLTHGEADPRVPREAVHAYLEAPELLAAAIELRNRVLQNWEGDGAPLRTEELLSIARGLVDDPPTALLLCHNVTRAVCPWFSRSVVAPAGSGAGRVHRRRDDLHREDPSRRELAEPAGQSHLLSSVRRR